MMKFFLSKWGWRLGLRWVAASVMATVVAYVCYYVLLFSLVALPPAVYNALYWVVSPLPGIIFGVVTGIAQAWVLRGRLQRAGRWIWASLLGWGLGWLGHDLLWDAWQSWMGTPPRFGPKTAAYAAAVLACVVLGRAVAGAVAGGGQWLVLRRQVPKAGWWVPASTMGAVLNGFCIAEC